MTTRRNFNKNVKLYLACANENLRPSMEHVYFQNGYAYASDGHILVRAKIADISNFEEAEIEKMNGKMLHYTMFKNILAYPFAQIIDDGVKVGDSLSEVVFCWSKCFVDYPNADKVITDAINKKASDDFKEIGLSPKLLMKLTNATGIDTPVAIIKDAMTAILIKGVDQDIIGLLMPKILD